MDDATPIRRFRDTRNMGGARPGAGRPPAPRAKRMPNHVAVHFDDVVYDLAVAYAHAEGLSLSAAIRRIVGEALAKPVLCAQNSSI